MLASILFQVRLSYEQDYNISLFMLMHLFIPYLPLLPLVLAMQEHIASKYAVGLYGNTMTTNPRALDVATDVLRRCTPLVRQNIIDRGVEFQSKFGSLCKKHPKILKRVTGSGLLQAVHLQENIPMFGGNHAGTKSFLASCRHAGIGVIK